MEGLITLCLYLHTLSLLRYIHCLWHSVEVGAGKPFWPSSGNLGKNSQRLNQFPTCWGYQPPRLTTSPLHPQRQHLSQQCTILPKNFDEFWSSIFVRLSTNKLEECAQHQPVKQLTGQPVKQQQPFKQVVTVTFIFLACWYLNWESWASSNPNQPVMTSQLSTHFEKLQLRHVHLGACAAWKQISAWKCCTLWGLLKMMPYQSSWTYMLIIDDLILQVDIHLFFLITGWCYTEIRWICVRIGAHAFEVGHFGQPTLKSPESAEIKNSKTWRISPRCSIQRSPNQKKTYGKTCYASQTIEKALISIDLWIYRWDKYKFVVSEYKGVKWRLLYADSGEGCFQVYELLNIGPLQPCSQRNNLKRHYEGTKDRPLQIKRMNPSVSLSK